MICSDDTKVFLMFVTVCKNIQCLAKRVLNYYHLSNVCHDSLFVQCCYCLESDNMCDHRVKLIQYTGKTFTKQRCVIHFDVFNVTNTHYSFIRLMLQNLNGERYVNTVSNTSTHNERKYRSLSRQIVLIRFLHPTKIMNQMMSIYTRLCLVGCASYCECVCVLGGDRQVL